MSRARILQWAYLAHVVARYVLLRGINKTIDIDNRVWLSDQRTCSIRLINGVEEQVY